MTKPLPAPSDIALPSRRLTLRVASVEPAGKDTKRFRLAALNGATLPSVAAGSHVTLNILGGFERQYSLLQPGHAPTEYVVAVRRENDGRGGSAALHDRVKPGDLIGLQEPRNLFPLDETAAESVLLGGGIGVTPLIAMARRLIELGQRFTFHAAFRDPAHQLLSEELETIQPLHLHYDDQAGGPLPLADLIAQSAPEAQFYCCGPAAMIDSFLSQARAQGVSEAQLHYEYFTSPEAPPRQGSITVELARSGITLTVPPGQSILEAVRAAGIPANSSCEAGTCGACEVKVLEGEPDHFDAVLTAQERARGDRMMICSSGARSKRLVLDL